MSTFTTSDSSLSKCLKNSYKATKIVLFGATRPLSVEFKQKAVYFFCRISLSLRAAELVLGSLHSGKSTAEKGCSIHCPFISMKTAHRGQVLLKKRMYKVNKNELKKKKKVYTHYK